MEIMTDNLVEDFMNRRGCKYDISEADNQLIDANTELSDENRLLKEELKRVYKRIDKAIEYMHEVLECNYHGGNVTFDTLIHNTENILKGVDEK